MMFASVELMRSLRPGRSRAPTSAMSARRYAISPFESEYCFSTLYGDKASLTSLSTPGWFLCTWHTRMFARLLRGDRAQVDLGEVNRADCGAVVEVARQRLCDLLPDHRLRLLRRAADVRREHDVRECAQNAGPRVERVVERRAVRTGLGGEDVDRGTGEVLGLQGSDERGDIDDSSTRVVDQVRALLHRCELLGGDHVDCVLRLGDVQRDEVGLGQQFFERLDLTRGAKGHDVDDVMEEDAQAERLCEDGELGADMAIADYSEGFTPYLPAALGLLVPEACTQLRGALKELARENDELGHDKLGDGARVGEGRVEDRDTRQRSGLEIDLVGADAEASNNKELRSWSQR